MLLRLATLGALGYAAYRFYEQNRDQVDEALGRLADGFRPRDETQQPAPADDAEVELAGGPLSDEARVVHPDEEPVASTG